MRTVARVTAALKLRSHDVPHGYQSEIAAYRISRLLGLDNVPPAIYRRATWSEIRQRFNQDTLDQRGSIRRAVVWDEDGSAPGAAIYWVKGLRSIRLEQAAAWQSWLKDADVPANHAALARDLGYTPVYLHYNTGLHVSSNGRAFAGLIEVLLEQWPVAVKELVIIGHSMGGLVSRSACHYGALAGHDWPTRLRKLVFLGTPHHGAPLERGGHWVDVILGVSPYTAPFARLGKIRSAGVTDLRHGNLLDEDWEGRDRFAHAQDLRQPVPLPKRVQCYAIAATTGSRAGDLGDRVLGDGLVPVDSALGRHADPRRALEIPESRQWIGYGMNHLDLLSHPEVYAAMKRWLAPRSARTA